MSYTEPTFVHDPGANLDYSWSWVDWLADGETITTSTVTVETTGLTLGSKTSAAGVVTQWVSGGTAGVAYRMTCHIVTSAGRQDERSMRLRCVDR